MSIPAVFLTCLVGVAALFALVEASEPFMCWWHGQELAYCEPVVVEVSP